jgi:hypothetical protein
VLAVVQMAKAWGPDAGDRAIRTFFQKKIPLSGVQASTGKRRVACPPNAIQMPVVAFLWAGKKWPLHNQFVPSSLLLPVACHPLPLREPCRTSGPSCTTSSNCSVVLIRGRSYPR